MGIIPANKITKQQKEIKMSILDFLGPKIAEPKDFDKDLFIKYYVEYHRCSSITHMGEDEAYSYFLGWYKDEKFYFDRTLISDECWNDENVATNKKVFKMWLSSKPKFIYWPDFLRDPNKIDFDSDHVYVKYLARPLLYARLYPHKEISKEILSILRTVQTTSEKDLQTIYDVIEKMFQEKKAKEAEDKRQAAMNVLLGKNNQR